MFCGIAPFKPGWHEMKNPHRVFASVFLLLSAWVNDCPFFGVTKSSRVVFLQKVQLYCQSQNHLMNNLPGWQVHVYMRVNASRENIVANCINYLINIAALILIAKSLIVPSTINRSDLHLSVDVTIVPFLIRIFILPSSSRAGLHTPLRPWVFRLH